MRQFSFYFILLSLPFVILFIFEITLRLFSYGHTYPLFVEAKIQDNQHFASKNTEYYLQPNGNVIKRYFANEKLAPKVSADTVYFKKKKDKDSFRIFIQGGSTAAGFPYGRWGSLQGMIEQRFKRLYPSKNIEIINTAMAAVNSYTLLDFVDEIIAEQPDLVLIYAGHNEYLGIMGVGSSFAAKGGRLATLLHLKFKELRIYQLVQSTYYLLFSSTPLNTKPDATLMSQVAKEKNITLDSELFQLGLTQFQENMSLILKKYQAANVPVIIGNLVSNERDQTPFSSISEIDWKKYVNSISIGNAAKEITEIIQLKANEKLTAKHYYKLALNYQLLSQYEKAKNAFILAKEHDLLRFRAPVKFNEIIEKLASQYNATLVDNQTTFSSHSPQGIIGNELILEHLHPTVKGYFLLSESYISAINSLEIIGAPIEEYSKLKADLDIPVSRLDKLYGDFTIQKLLNDYPFTPLKKKKNNTVSLPSSKKFEKDALIKRINKTDWLTLQKELLVTYQQRKNIAEAAKIAGNIATAMVENHQAYFIAGQLYQQLNDWQLASYYHQRAVEIKHSDQQYLLALAQDYFFLKQYNKSLSVLKETQQLVSNTSATFKQIQTYVGNVNLALKQQKNKENVDEKH